MFSQVRLAKRKASESVEKDEGDYPGTSIQQPGTAIGSTNLFCVPPPPYSKYQAPGASAKCDFGQSTESGSNGNCSKLGNGIQSKASGPNHPFTLSSSIPSGNPSDVPIKMQMDPAASQNPAELQFLKRMKALNTFFANSVENSVNSNPSLSLAPMVREYLYYTRVIMEEQIEQIGRPNPEKISKSFKSLGDFFEEFEQNYVLRSNLSSTSFSTLPPPNVNNFASTQDSAPTNGSPNLSSTTSISTVPPNLNVSSFASTQDSTPTPTGNFNGLSTVFVPSWNTSTQNSAPQKPTLSIFTFSTQIGPTPTTSSASKEKVEEDEDDGDGEDEPPKVEVIQVKEDDSVYSVRCKIFNLVDNEYKDKGVGTLYIKENEKGTYQVVVRADNNLGTILLNILLQKSLPLAKNKKSVSTVDLSKKDGNGKPLQICIRVNEELVNELFDKLKEFQQA